MGRQVKEPGAAGFRFVGRAVSTKCSSAAVSAGAQVPAVRLSRVGYFLLGRPTMVGYNVARAVVTNGCCSIRYVLTERWTLQDQKERAKGWALLGALGAQTRRSSLFMFQQSFGSRQTAPATATHELQPPARTWGCGCCAMCYVSWGAPTCHGEPGGPGVSVWFANMCLDGYNTHKLQSIILLGRLSVPLIH